MNGDSESAGRETESLMPGRGTEPLVQHAIDADERVSEAIVDAFLDGGVDVYGKDSTVQDWVDTDALEGFDWPAEGIRSVSARIWGHPVVITAADVEIYADTGGT